MISALVMIRCERDQIPEAARTIVEFEGVDEVYSVTGEWDLVPVSRSHAGSWSQMSSPNGSPRFGAWSAPRR